MRLAVLGAGNMGSALIRGVLASSSGVTVIAWDAVEAARGRLPAGVRAVPPDTWFARGGSPDMVVVAVKPGDVAGALKPLVEPSRQSAGTLWCSIAAGVSIAKIEQTLGSGRRICRIMPNTPAVVGLAASAFALNNACGPRDAEAVKNLLSSCGIAVQVPEKLMNAVTGLSGSGPAYVYLFIEALIEGGVTAGLPCDVARKLAVQTVQGAAAMVARTDSPPAALKAAVMSPGGTTAAGLMALEENGMKYGVIRAVVQASRRAEELGS